MCICICCDNILCFHLNINTGWHRSLHLSKVLRQVVEQLVRRRPQCCSDEGSAHPDTKVRFQRQAKQQKPNAQMHKCTNARMLNAKCSNAQMPNAQLPNARMPNAQLPNAQMPNGQMPNGQMVKCQIGQCQMLKCQMPTAQMLKCQMPNGQLPIRTGSPGK